MEPENQLSLAAPTLTGKASSVSSAAVGKPVSKVKGEGYFNDRLESVRGIAAMMVALSHSIVMVPCFGWQVSILYVLQRVMNGRAAVTLFFVLSGLVLGLSLRRGRETFPVELTEFYIRRFFRIYPAFLFCTLTILVYLTFFFSDLPVPNAGEWFEKLFGVYHDPLTAGRVAGNLVFSSNSLNLVTWTLQVEMVCSLLLPFIHRLAVRASLGWRLALLGGVIGVGFIPQTYPHPMSFMFMFYAGYLIPLIGPSVVGYLRQTRQRAIWVMAGALILLLGSGLVRGRQLIIEEGLLIETFGASVLIACLLYGKDFGFYKLLDHSVTRFYGRISYSLYLWHLFCLFLVSRNVIVRIPKECLWRYSLLWALVLWLLSALAATLMAYVSYRFIEKPLIKLSKEICRRLNSGGRIGKALGQVAH